MSLASTRQSSHPPVALSASALQFHHPWPKTVVDQLKAHGHTRRGWLGVRIQMVTPEIAESLGLEAPKGALVSSVTPEGPADKAKIEAGDVVVKLRWQRRDRYAPPAPHRR